MDERLAGPNIAVEAVSDRRVVALGDSARVVVTVYNRSAMQISARPGWPGAPAGSMVAILPDSSYGWTTYLRGTEITQPWWLATPRIGDLFSVPIGRLSEDEREKMRWLSVVTCASDANCVTHRTPIVFHFADPVRGDIQRPLAVVPRISVTLDNPVELARANIPFDRYLATCEISADVTEACRRFTVTPAGLKADSRSGRSWWIPRGLAPLHSAFAVSCRREPTISPRLRLWRGHESHRIRADRLRAYHT